MPPVRVPNFPHALTQPTSTAHRRAHAETSAALRGRAIPSDFATVALPPPASSTRIVKWNVPAAFGVPATVPLVEMVKPDGIAPALTDHVYGVTPPVAFKVTGEYSIPTSPAWNVALTIFS